MKKRLLALLLTVVMVVSMLPVQAFAQEETPAETTAATVPETTAAPETTEAAAPETTEATVPVTTEATVPETTEATVPETTEATVPETTEATVPETTEATVPETTEATVPELDLFGITSQCGGDLTWEVNGGTLTIRGHFEHGYSDMYDFPDGAPWDVYADRITTIDMQAGLSIGQNAFAKLANVTTLKLPYMLATFAPSDLAGMTKLASISFPDGNENGFSAGIGTDILQSTEAGKTLCFVSTATDSYVVFDALYAVADNAFANCNRKALCFYVAAPSFGPKAFAGLDGTAIWYDGTKDGWDSVTKEATAYGGQNLKWLDCSVTSGTCGDSLTWQVKDGTLTIAGTGSLPAYTETNVPWSFQEQKITTLVLSVNNFDFDAGTLRTLSGLKKISVTDSASGYYTNSEGTVLLENSETGSTVRYALPSVTQYTIPDAVTTIGTGAFAACEVLTLTIPEQKAVKLMDGSLPIGADLVLNFEGLAPEISDNAFEYVTAVINFNALKDAQGWQSLRTFCQWEHGLTWNNAYKVVLGTNPTTLISTSESMILNASLSESVEGASVKWEVTGIMDDALGIGEPITGLGNADYIKEGYAYISDEDSSKLCFYERNAPFTVYLKAVSSDGLAEPAMLSIAVVTPEPEGIAVYSLDDRELEEKEPLYIDLNDVTSFRIPYELEPEGAREDVKFTLGGSWKNLVNVEYDDNGEPVFTHKDKAGSFTVTLSIPGTKISRTITVKLERLATELTIKHSLTEKNLNCEVYLPYVDETVHPDVPMLVLRSGSKITLTTNVATDKTLTDRTVTWEIQEQCKPYASINSKGVLTTYPVSQPTAILVCASTANGNVSDALDIVLLPAVQAVSLAAYSMGSTYSLVPEAPDGDITDWELQNWDVSYGSIVLEATSLPTGSMTGGTWSVSNSKIASLEVIPESNDSVAILTPKGTGKVTVTFTSGDGTKLKTTKTVVFTGQPTYIEITPDPVKEPLTDGKSMTFKATNWATDDIKAKNQKVYWWVYEPNTWTDEEGNEHEGQFDVSWATISSNGKLTVKNVPKNTTLKVVAYTYEPGGDYYVENEIEVPVKPKADKKLVLGWYDGAGVFWPYEDSELLDYEYYWSADCAWYNSKDGVYEPLSEEDRANLKIKSSNSSVVSIEEIWGELALYPNKVGSATITATCGKDKDTVKVTSARVIDRIEVADHPDELVSGKSMTLKATTWADEDWNGDPITVKATSQKVGWFGPFLVNDDGTIYWDENSGYVYTDGATISSNGRITAQKGLEEAKQVAFVAESYFGMGGAMSEPVIITIRPAWDYKAFFTNNDNGEIFTGPLQSELGEYPWDIDRALDFHVCDYLGNPVDIESRVFTSSKPSVVSIDRTEGTVASYKVGTSKITCTATLRDGTTVATTVPIEVFRPILDIEIAPRGISDPDSCWITGGKTLNFSAKLNQDAGFKPTDTKIVWGVYDVDSTDDDIDVDDIWRYGSRYATISSSGVLKTSKVYDKAHTVAVVAWAQRYGFYVSEPYYVRITPKASCLMIGLADGDDAVLLNGMTKNLDCGEEYELIGTVFPEDVSQELTWSTSNKKVAQIEMRDGKYYLKITGKGTATIKATTTDGSRISTSFKVNGIPTT